MFSLLKLFSLYNINSTLLFLSQIYIYLLNFITLNNSSTPINNDILINNTNFIIRINQTNHFLKTMYKPKTFKIKRREKYL